MLGVLLDFWGLDRTRFLLKSDAADAPGTAPSVEPAKDRGQTEQPTLTGWEVKKGG
jgi:hypothetical protein